MDREERPDLDAIYMDAAQAMTGSGGWPLTVFLTPDGKPFFAGTYFPPVPQHGLPSFPQVLNGIAEAWADRRDEVVTQAGKIAEHIARAGLLSASRGAADGRDHARRRSRACGTRSTPSAAASAARRSSRSR